MTFEQQTDHALRAVSFDGSRLARELHDGVAHSLTVMTVQAAGARRVVEADPAQAMEAIIAIERSGREALMELRRLLVMLRPAGSVQAELEVSPSMEHLPMLIRQINRAGVHAVLHVEGEARVLHRDIELCAYRIVQEALTNVIKHAGECQAEVTVRYRPAALELEVRNHGRIDPGRSQGGGIGSGLSGMRQRTQQLGGQFEAGSYGGGYRIRARLPIAR
jgi:signal transduction histidine kinase